MPNFEDIMKDLFHNQTAWYVDMFGKVKSNKTTLFMDRNNCTSQEHVEKWLCINDLLNIMHYFNTQCIDDVCTKDTRYSIGLNLDGEPIISAANNDYGTAFVFNRYEDAEKAIEIIGKEKLKKIFMDRV